MTQYLGGTKHFFLLILYNFKNIGGHVQENNACAAFVDSVNYAVEMQAVR